MEAFSDPELNAAVDEALADNLDIRAAWARLEQGVAQVRKQGSAFWPQLEARLGTSGRRFYMEQPDLSGLDVSEGLDNVSIPTTRQGSDVANFDLSVAAAWEADLWGQIASLEDAALHDQLAGREDLSAALVSLASQVVETWFSWQSSRRSWRSCVSRLRLIMRCLTGQIALRSRNGPGHRCASAAPAGVEYRGGTPPR